MLRDLQIKIQYLKDDVLHEVDASNKRIHSDLEVQFSKEKVQTGFVYHISLLPRVEITLEKIELSSSHSYSNNCRIFANGYQSWTDSCEYLPSEKLPRISKLANPVMNTYAFNKYGDYDFYESKNQRGCFHSFTYSYIREGKDISFVGSLTERNGYTIIETNVNKKSLKIIKDCKGLLINKSYQALDLFVAHGEENVIFDEYFHLMNIEKPKVRPMKGWTSWYNYYQNINQEIILQNLHAFTDNETKIDIFQIDDGYQTAVGDWLSIDSTKFSDGMEVIAKQIHEKGLLAGLWLAPFAAERNSQLVKNHPEWILQDEKGEKLLAGSNWSGFYALDFYHPEVQAYLKNVFHVILHEWKYDMVKLDFLYAVCYLPRPDKTRGQIMTEAMEFLRECVGDKIILGCGVPLGPSFGLVDFCRVGCDVGLDWNDKFYMRYLHRERISTLNSIKNAIGRRHLNGRAFYNDPDVFLLRDENIQLSKVQKETLAKVNSIFGSLLFTSDYIGKYDESTQEFFQNIMGTSPATLESVQWIDTYLITFIFEQNEQKQIGILNLSSNLRHFSMEDLLGNTLTTSTANKGQSSIQPYECILQSIQ